MTESVVVLPPSPAWSAQFALEAARISHSLGALGHEVAHIGSTSIAGIYAKPIIDMLLLVESLESLDAREDLMAAIGYEAKGEYGIPERRYFRKTSAEGARTHHVHAFVRGSSGAARHLAFRDYMNAHPAAAGEYSALKRALAARHSNNAPAYIAGKEKFVRHYEALALAWAVQSSNGA